MTKDKRLNLTERNLENIKQRQEKIVALINKIKQSNSSKYNCENSKKIRKNFVLVVAILCYKTNEYIPEIKYLLGGLVENMPYIYLNQYDDFGCNALHYIAKWGTEESAKLLLGHGANIKAKTCTKNMLTPLEIAFNNDNDEVAKYLLERINEGKPASSKTNNKSINIQRKFSFR